MIRISYKHAVLSCTYNIYKFIISVETDDIIMATQKIICFEILTKEFDTKYDYKLQEGPNSSSSISPLSKVNMV